MTVVRDGSRPIGGGDRQSKSKAGFVAEHVRSIMTARGLSLRDTAKQIGVSKGTLENLLNKNELSLRSLNLIKAWAQRL